MTFTKVEVHPYIKNGRTEKTTYRPVSTLLNDSKVYERSLYDQINFFLKINFRDISAALHQSRSV